MGQLREFNPKMISEWHAVSFHFQESDKRVETNQWGRSYVTYAGFIERRDNVTEWCKGPMIHGRFAYDGKLHGSFFFKSKRDAMTFKLAFSGG